MFLIGICIGVMIKKENDYLKIFIYSGVFVIVRVEVSLNVSVFYK